MDLKYYKYIGVFAVIGIVCFMLSIGWYFAALFVATLPVAFWLMWDKVK